MASHDLEARRISDVDRDLKSFRDEVLKFGQKLDGYVLEIRQWRTGLKHSFDEAKMDDHHNGRVIPRAIQGDFSKGFHSQHCLGPRTQYCVSNELEVKQRNHRGSHFDGSRSFRHDDKLLVFDGSSQIAEFWAWVDAIEDYIEETNPPEKYHCRIASYKLAGDAYTWWKKLQCDRVSSGKEKITSWVRMKRLLFKRFLYSTSSKECPAQIYNSSQANGNHMKQMKDESLLPAKCSTEVPGELYINKQDEGDDLRSLGVCGLIYEENNIEALGKIQPSSLSIEGTIEHNQLESKPQGFELLDCVDSFEDGRGTEQTLGMKVGSSLDEKPERKILTIQQPKAKELQVNEVLGAARGIYNVQIGERQMGLYQQLPEPGIIVVDDCGQLIGASFMLYLFQVLILNLLVKSRIIIDGMLSFMFDPGGNYRNDIYRLNIRSLDRGNVYVQNCLRTHCLEIKPPISPISTFDTGMVSPAFASSKHEDNLAQEAIIMEDASLNRKALGITRCMSGEMNEHEKVMTSYCPYLDNHSITKYLFHFITRCMSGEMNEHEKVMTSYCPYLDNHSITKYLFHFITYTDQHKVGKTKLWIEFSVAVNHFLGGNRNLRCLIFENFAISTKQFRSRLHREGIVDPIFIDCKSIILQNFDELQRHVAELPLTKTGLTDRIREIGLKMTSIQYLFVKGRNDRLNILNANVFTAVGIIEALLYVSIPENNIAQTWTVSFDLMKNCWALLQHNFSMSAAIGKTKTYEDLDNVIKGMIEGEVEKVVVSNGIVDSPFFLVPSEYSWTASKQWMRMIRKIAKRKLIRWFLVLECLRECMVLYLNRSRVPAIASTSSIIEEQEILRCGSHEVTKRLPYRVHKSLYENLELKNKRKQLGTWGELCFTEQYSTLVLRGKLQPSDILIDEVEMFIFDPGGCWSVDDLNSRLLLPVYLCLEKVPATHGRFHSTVESHQFIKVKLHQFDKHFRKAWMARVLNDVIAPQCNLQTNTKLNLTRGRVILLEGWNDENNVDMEKKFIMVELIIGSCVKILCKNGQFRESLKLFHNVVNGLDPPMNLYSACEASMWISTSSLVDELLRRRDGLM